MGWVWNNREQSGCWWTGCSSSLQKGQLSLSPTQPWPRDRGPAWPELTSQEKEIHILTWTLLMLQCWQLVKTVLSKTKHRGSEKAGARIGSWHPVCSAVFSNYEISFQLSGPSAWDPCSHCICICMHTVGLFRVGAGDSAHSGSVQWDSHGSSQPPW